MLRNALLLVRRSRVLIFLSSLLLACAGSPPTSAPTDEAGLYVVGRSVLEDGTYLTSVSNTIVVLPVRP